jgi:acetyl esterase/lipase
LVIGQVARGFRCTALAATGMTLLAGCVASMSAHQQGHLYTMFGRLFSMLVSEHAVRVERNIAFGPDPRHRLDVYRPSQLSEAGPIIIFYYGGGWTTGDRRMYGFVGSALAARGFTTVIPDYRLYPTVKFPTFVEDAALAYAWVAATIGKSAGRQRAIIVMGHSAGAHTAALLTFDRSYIERAGHTLPRPAALISLAGPLSFDPTTWPTTKKIFEPASDHPDSARPIAFVKPGEPPTLLLHGVPDNIVRIKNSRETAAALREGGNDVTEIEYPSLGHIGIILAIARPLRWRADVLDDVTKFISRDFGRALSPTLPIRAEAPPKF